MSIFISELEKERLKNADRNSLQWKCYTALKERVQKNTAQNALVQTSDTQEWYHLCWERISDASFVYHMEEHEALGAWLHDRVMEIVRKSQDEWIGPWYRERLPIPEGFLETAHITLAVCEAVENCPSLFTPSELEECIASIQEKGMLPCMRYCKRIVEEAGHINNWFMICLDGFGTAATILKNTEYIELAFQWAKVAAGLYNEDSYGESLQYANYATLHLSHLNETLIRSGNYTPAELSMDCYTNLMIWNASSFLYYKPLAEGEASYARTINFGDSAALYRPSGDVLVQISGRMKEKAALESGLAAWMFHTLYADPEVGPDELATFGIFNHFGYLSVLMLPDCAAPLSPSKAKLDTSAAFSIGQIISRDNWEDAKATVAIQAGYVPCNVTSHRHKDQNSFQLVIGSERMLIDPGHCCYRLNSQKEAISELSHNTISIKKNGVIMEQAEVTGNIFKPKPAGNKLLENSFWGNVQIVASDMSGLYDDTIEKAVRIWVMNLPHQMLTVDIVKASEKVSLCTHFCVNNRDGRLKEHIYSDQRLVFRRGGQALKLFEMYSSCDNIVKPAAFSFDWTSMHDYYHPLPNQAGQGKDGSAPRYIWEDEPGFEHIRIHTYTMDTSEEIVHWHVYYMDDGFVRMENPDATAWLDVKADMNQLLLRNERGEMKTLLVF